MNKSLKILLGSAEAVPFAKMGGLADVAGSLPQALRQLGHDARLALPKYKGINAAKFGLTKVLDSLAMPAGSDYEMASIFESAVDGMPAYLVGSDKYFSRKEVYGYYDDGERFVFFCRATLEMLKEFDWQPDVIHCNDWHTGIIPKLGELLFSKMKTDTQYQAHRPRKDKVMAETQQRIADLDQLVDSLSSRERELFQRIFHVSTTIGSLKPPASMHGWIKDYFGSIEAVLEQRIVKVTNLVTLEGSLFNELRSMRPMEAKDASRIEEAIMKNIGDPFCKPLDGTPADTFGRVRGKHSITASNVAKYDGFHGVVIFDEHNPLVFSSEAVSDYIDTALAWAHKAHDADRGARYFFFMWNCLWKSGASIIHGHAQMTLSRGLHYPKVEHLRRSALRYQEAHGVNYFDDLYKVHRALGLTLENGHTRGLAYLTPIKEKEVLLISQELDQDLKDSIYKVLKCFVERMGVRSFNLALYHKPIADVEEDWSGFPVVVRIVDRGDPNNKASDMGAMELYAASVISSDPFRVASVLRDSLR